MIRVLVNAFEVRDAEMVGHSEHVANLLQLLYHYMPPVCQKEIPFDELEYTGLLHDVGKIGVPEYVLNKNEKLSDRDWELK